MENKPVSAMPSRLRSLLIRQWHPLPVPQPQVHRDLPRLPATQRFAEVLRYSLLRLEYWVSPGGGLREWARFNVGLALLIGIPALIVVPLITFLLCQFTSWTNYLVQIAQNFLLFPLLMLAAVALFTALLCFIRGLIGR